MADVSSHSISANHFYTRKKDLEFQGLFNVGTLGGLELPLLSKRMDYQKLNLFPRFVLFSFLSAFLHFFEAENQLVFSRICLRGLPDHFGSIPFIENFYPCYPAPG